jgi:hypothetical protein
VQPGEPEDQIVLLDLSISGVHCDPSASQEEPEDQIVLLNLSISGVHCDPSATWRSQSDHLRHVLFGRNDIQILNKKVITVDLSCLEGMTRNIE